MSIEIDYSVIIRTTGHAGQKYQKLLDSIKNLNPAPKEVIVVLPEGVSLPMEQIGCETFYHCPRGMVIQRMVGVAKCRTPYALICDDDVTFGSEFIKQLYRPVKEGKASFSIAPLYSFLPPKGLHALVCMVMGTAVPFSVHKKRYISVLRTTGYSYNRHLNRSKRTYYETQSAPWTCFFADIQALKDICFNDEGWLDMHGYSALDDQTMFYKAWLNNKKTVVVSTAQYIHLDAKTSVRNNKPAYLYSSTFNRVVFWKRFIYDQQNSSALRLWSWICFAYRMSWYFLWDFLLISRKKMTKEDYEIEKKGYREGKKYIHSSKFKNMPPVIVK